MASYYFHRSIFVCIRITWRGASYNTPKVSCLGYVPKISISSKFPDDAEVPGGGTTPEKPLDSRFPKLISSKNYIGSIFFPPSFLLKLSLFLFSFPSLFIFSFLAWTFLLLTLRGTVGLCQRSKINTFKKLTLWFAESWVT